MLPQPKITIAGSMFNNLPENSLQYALEIWNKIGRDRWDSYLDFVYDFVEMNPNDRAVLYLEATSQL